MPPVVPPEPRPAAARAGSAPVPADRLRLPVLGVQLSVLSLGCGIPITEKFTAGNAVQLVALLLLLPAWSLLSRRDVLVYALVLVGVVGSPFALVVLTDESPQWLQIPFFVLCVTYLFCCVRLAPHVDARRLLRTPVDLAAALLVATALYQRSFDPAQRGSLLTLYFDDKSHAVVAAVCLAFLVLWVNRSFWRLPAAILLLAVAASTASRLIVFAAPFLALALLASYLRTRRQATQPLMVYLHHLTLLSVPVLVGVVLSSPWTTYLQERLAGGTAAGASAEASTRGHLELAALATRLKLHDPVVALLGVGPGGFPAGVRGLGIDASGFAAVDPSGYRGIMDNTHFVPVHSVTLTVLVEYPIWVAIAFVVLWWRIGIGLVRRHDGVLACMAGGLFLMTTFYSAHNEFFYWAALAVLCLAAFGPDRAPATPSPP